MNRLTVDARTRTTPFRRVIARVLYRLRKGEVQRTVSCVLKTCLIQREHVEVADVVLLRVSDPGATLLLVDHLAHVLAHKRALKGASNGFSSDSACLRAGLTPTTSNNEYVEDSAAVAMVTEAASFALHPVLSSVSSSIVCACSVSVCLWARYIVYASSCAGKM